MQFAYTAMKLVTKASETVDEPEWYSLLAMTLEFLDKLEVNRQLIEAWFYIQSAYLLGEGINLRTDAVGQPLESDKVYMFDNIERAFRPSEQGNIGADHIKLLRLIDSKTLEHSF